jgi:hypothetical protein
MASPTGTTAARLKIVLQHGQALALSEISVRMNAEAPAQFATIGSLKLVLDHKPKGLAWWWRIQAAPRCYTHNLGPINQQSLWY